jgi:acetyl-CoA acetyltransferase
MNPSLPSGSSAVNLAVQSLKAGTTDVALALGAEKMNIPDKAKAFALFDAGWDVSRAEENYATLIKMGEGVVPPPGSESDRPCSKFMAIYAALCRHHMKTYGTTQRQLAAVCAKNHQHSVHNPWSQFRKPFTIEEVLAAPPITFPLTLPMCAPLSDGAAAAILCTEDGLKRIGADKARCIKVAASVIRSFSFRRLDQPEKHVSRLAALQAYESA